MKREILSVEDIRNWLHERALRSTGARVAVIQALARAARPMSSSEVSRDIGFATTDAATVYRNLVKLEECGLVEVAARVDGMDRYALAPRDDERHGSHSAHPHFVCNDCGEVSCLPADVQFSIKTHGRWNRSVRDAVVQLIGACPACAAGGAD